VIAVVFLLDLSSAALAGYAIELKNGRVLLTPDLWEEKGVIKFYLDSGIASIAKEIARSTGFTKKIPVMSPPKLKKPIPEPKVVAHKEKNTGS
jgi:hypothetical protein